MPGEGRNNVMRIIISIMFLHFWFLMPCMGCNLIGHRNMTMEERLEKFDIVVYGRDSDHLVRKGKYVDFTDSIFEVYCVLKGDANVTGNITIEEILPKTACSGTYIYYLTKMKGNIRPGLEIIVGLERLENGNYVWQEVNQLESSAFDPTDENWNKIVKVLPSENWSSSKISDTGCPQRFFSQPAQKQESAEQPDSVSKPEPEPEVNIKTGSQSSPSNSASMICMQYLLMNILLTVLGMLKMR